MGILLTNDDQLIQDDGKAGQSTAGSWEPGVGEEEKNAGKMLLLGFWGWCKTDDGLRGKCNTHFGATSLALRSNSSALLCSIEAAKDKDANTILRK